MSDTSTISSYLVRKRRELSSMVSAFLVASRGRGELFDAFD